MSAGQLQRPREEAAEAAISCRPEVSVYVVLAISAHGVAATANIPRCLRGNEFPAIRFVLA